MFFDFQVFGNVVAKCFLLSKSLETLSQNVFCFPSLWKRCRKMFFAFQVFGNAVAKCFLLSKSLEMLSQNVLSKNNCFLSFPKGFHSETIVFCHFLKDFA